MKKGFTLVEMSIVLVIIGVLMGLTVKGKQLIDSAKLRADMNKVRNIQIAVAAYMADNNGIFPNNFSAKNLSRTLNAEDYTLKTATQNLTVTQVLIRTTTASGTGADAIPAGTVTPYYLKATVGNDVAVVLGPDAGDEALNGSNRVFGCKIDATLDDKIQTSGLVRGYGSTTPPKSNDKAIEATDCEANFSSDIPTYAMLIY